jgi:hypothetical protein
MVQHLQPTPNTIPNGVKKEKERKRKKEEKKKRKVFLL